MIPCVTKESFTEKLKLVDGQDIRIYSISVEFSETSPMSHFGPRGQILAPNLTHNIEIVQPKEGGQNVWFWGHGAKEKDGGAMALLWTMQYSSFEEAVFDTNVYRLFWCLKANLFTLWVKREIPCYIDDVAHAGEFTDESVMDFIAAGAWAPDTTKPEEEMLPIELRHAIANFDNYVKLGIFLKDVGIMTGLKIDDNPYRKRLLQDFEALALQREEQYK